MAESGLQIVHHQRRDGSPQDQPPTGQKEGDAFPARAGMNRLFDGRGQLVVGVPRPRGDEPSPRVRPAWSRWRSPPARG